MEGDLYFPRSSPLSPFHSCDLQNDSKNAREIRARRLRDGRARFARYIEKPIPAYQIERERASERRDAASTFHLYRCTRERRKAHGIRTPVPSSISRPAVGFLLLCATDCHAFQFDVTSPKGSAGRPPSGPETLSLLSRWRDAVLRECP